MAGLSHAIDQLVWLVRDDFQQRNCPTYRYSDGAWVEGWWQHTWGREEAARIRSYIAAIRVLRGQGG